MSLIEDRIGPKYRIGDYAFTIEHMRRHDGSAMPQPHAHPFTNCITCSKVNGYTP